MSFFLCFRSLGPKPPLSFYLFLSPTQLLLLLPRAAPLLRPSRSIPAARCFLLHQDAAVLSPSPMFLPIHGRAGPFPSWCPFPARLPAAHRSVPAPRARGQLAAGLSSTSPEPASARSSFSPTASPSTSPAATRPRPPSPSRAGPPPAPPSCGRRLLSRAPLLLPPVACAPPPCSAPVRDRKSVV